MNCINMLYFVPYGSNFGDDITPLILKKIFPDKIYNIIDLAKIHHTTLSEKRNIVSLGSIFHNVPDNSVVCGTGINPNYKRIPKNCKIIAVRGNLTFKMLKENGYDINENDVAFGDPALLIPRLFPEWLIPIDIKYKMTLIPHNNDKKYVEDIVNKVKYINVSYCDSGFTNILETIRKSEIVVSSSLHGIIVSEMLNKHTIWLQLPGSKQSESDFKYIEYYNSTGRYNVVPITNILKIKDWKFKKPIYNDTRLYNAFLKSYELLTK